MLLDWHPNPFIKLRDAALIGLTQTQSLIHIALIQTLNLEFIVKRFIL